MLKVKNALALISEAAKSWYSSNPFQFSAIIAYYAILSLPALMIIIFNIVGAIWGRDIVQGEILGEISRAIGRETAESIRMMLVDQGNEKTSVFATVVGIGTLIYGSTGVFFQLQTAFDRIWESKQTQTNEILVVIYSRLKSFGFILIIGFLLLISFVLTSLLNTFSKRLHRFLPR
ncbi:YihY/virulence factor BrkB family protein [Lacinutrix neustonica]|uniref:YihY/virulence factor BrkB family protein n=1 Tax=Lacinutrix neustonica TaxID=2980107 RepID=A0A9E8MVS7_9FLAO|nr:YhjD/YihY/BrkB family envelope integrity protein [Lacinutrix neustonica]WAC02408.1 YihY/virulence factor BrkB family protein [Lacinutrix neustonica]